MSVPLSGRHRVQSLLLELLDPLSLDELEPLSLLLLQLLLEQ
ncbi:hypothetical protein ACE0DR_06220 [Azotobacter sp. CWF10]